MDAGHTKEDDPPASKLFEVSIAMQQNLLAHASSSHLKTRVCVRSLLQRANSKKSRVLQG